MMILVLLRKWQIVRAFLFLQIKISLTQLAISLYLKGIT